MNAKVVQVGTASTSSHESSPKGRPDVASHSELAHTAATSDLRKEHMELRRDSQLDRSVSAFREVALGSGIFRRELTEACVSRDRAHRGDVLEASITYNRSDPQSDVVVKIERLRDPNGDARSQCERMQLRVKAFAATPGHKGLEQRNEAVEFITTSLRGLLARGSARSKGEIQYGRLLSAIRRMDNGHRAVSELCAENVLLEFEASGSQPIVLDGLVLKDCENLTIIGHRTNEEKVDGVFSVLAPYMILDGGFGGITIKGVDCSKLRLVNLDDSQVSMVRFVECQLRGMRADGRCSLQIFSAWDCSFGDGVDLADLSVKNPPRSIEEFKVVFGGTIWAKNGSFVLPANFEFERFKGLLEEIPSGHAASTMLAKRCEVSLANLIQYSTALEPSVVQAREDTKVLEISFANKERVIVSCAKYPPLEGWRVSEVSLVSEIQAEPTTPMWTRKRLCKSDDMASLESIVDDLFERKLYERKMFESACYEQ